MRALEYGLRRIKELPLSKRLLREVHEKLMQGARGGNKQPGAFRRVQNRIGGSSFSDAVFVPPPPQEVEPCMDALEQFLHADKASISELVKAALAHVQFETIHPFLDGNGRIGRLLISLMLHHKGLLPDPLLYLSLYFKTHRTAYYEHLQRVRTHGYWEGWVKFFLTGVAETAAQAADTAKRLMALFDEDTRKIERLGRARGSMLVLHKIFQKNPAADTAMLGGECSLSPSAILSALKRLEHLGIVEEFSGKQRYKRFIYPKYINILNQGTETPPG